MWIEKEIAELVRQYRTAKDNIQEAKGQIYLHDITEHGDNAREVLKYVDCVKEAVQIKTKLDLYFSQEHGWGIGEVIDYMIVPEAVGEEQFDGEFCEQKEFPDCYVGTFYYRIEESEEFVSIFYIMKKG